MRQRRGRSGNRPDVLSVDFQAAETHGGAENDPPAASLGAQLAREAAGRDDDPGFLKRGVLVGAFAALSERQKQIVFRRGVNEDTPKELAQDLGVSENVIRQDHFHGLRTLRDLIAHASADPGGLPSEERERLYAYLDGSMARGERTAFKKHLNFCSSCQRLAELERDVRWSGAHVLLPVPLVIAGWKPAGALAASSGAGAAPGPSAAAAKGSAVAAKLTGLGAGLGAKIAVGATLATLVVGTGIAGVGAYQWDQDRAPTAKAPAGKKAPAAAAATPVRAAVLSTSRVARPESHPRESSWAGRPERERPSRRKQRPEPRARRVKAARISAARRVAPIPAASRPIPTPVPAPASPPVLASPATAPPSQPATAPRPSATPAPRAAPKPAEFGFEG